MAEDNVWDWFLTYQAKLTSVQDDLTNINVAALLTIARILENLRYEVERLNPNR